MNVERTSIMPSGRNHAYADFCTRPLEFKEIRKAWRQRKKDEQARREAAQMTTRNANAGVPLQPAAARTHLVPWPNNEYNQEQASIYPENLLLPLPHEEQNYPSLTFDNLTNYCILSTRSAPNAYDVTARINPSYSRN